MRIGSGLRPVMPVFAVLLFSLVMTLPIVALEYICQENNLWLKRLLKQVPE